MDSNKTVILNAQSFKQYIDSFNNMDKEQPELFISNKNAWNFIKENIPLFECPDKHMEMTYYFRWWSYRKHIFKCKSWNNRYLVSEIIQGKEKTVVVFPAALHIFEGRWLHNSEYIDDYTVFWNDRLVEKRRYSDFVPYAAWNRYLVTYDREHMISLLDGMLEQFAIWSSENRSSDGLYYQIDDSDGMEISISGSGGIKIRGDMDRRPTINSYMYGYMTAISFTAELAGKMELSREYYDKAEALKIVIQEKLWDRKDIFFKTLKGSGRVNDEINSGLSDVREQIGFTPWFFNMPEDDKGYEAAWSQLMDSSGFYAPFGPTTAEQRHADFAVRYSGHECQWCGPSWPFSTSITLTAMANVLNKYSQDSINKSDYFNILGNYTHSHQRITADGRIVSWIDENLDPYTGTWLAGYLRSKNEEKLWYSKTWRDYNHSTYCDLIISGLVGLRPGKDDILEVNPLLPNEDVWKYFCLDNILYHGKIITILWDKTGEKYNRGKGFRIFIDGKEALVSESLTKVTVELVKNI